MHYLHLSLEAIKELNIFQFYSLYQGVMILKARDMKSLQLLFHIAKSPMVGLDIKESFFDDIVIDEQDNKQYDKAKTKAKEIKEEGIMTESDLDMLERAFKRM